MLLSLFLFSYPPPAPSPLPRPPSPEFPAIRSSNKKKKAFSLSPFYSTAGLYARLCVLASACDRRTPCTTYNNDLRSWSARQPSYWLALRHTRPCRKVLYGRWHGASLPPLPSLTTTPEDSGSVRVQAFYRPSRGCAPLRQRGREEECRPPAREERGGNETLFLLRRMHATPHATQKGVPRAEWRCFQFLPPAPLPSPPPLSPQQWRQHTPNQQPSPPARPLTSHNIVPTSEMSLLSSGYPPPPPSNGADPPRAPPLRPLHVLWITITQAWRCSTLWSRTFVCIVPSCPTPSSRP